MRGISSLVAISIVVAISLVVVTAVALWSVGIIGRSGYGTRPTRLSVFGGMEAMGYEEASQFKIMVKNLGSDTVYIDDIIIDGKAHAKIFSATTLNDENRLLREGNELVVKVGPGETVRIWGLVKGIKFSAGTEHEVKFRLANGLEFYKVISVKYVSLYVKGYGAYNLGVKREDGKIAGLLRTRIRNVRGADLINGRIEIYLLGDTKPVVTESLPSEYATLRAGKEKEVNIYFGIPPNYLSRELVVKLTYDVKGGGKEEFAYVVPPPKPIKVYILYISGTPGSWIDPTTLYNTAKEVVGEENVVMIDTIDKLVDLFKNGAKHKRAIIISTYGESLPGPDKSHDEWGIFEVYNWTGNPSIHDPNTPIYVPVHWKNWFKFVRDTIADNEMIYVNPIGIFGWYYVTKPDNSNVAYSHYDWRPVIVGAPHGNNGRFHRCSHTYFCTDQPIDIKIETNGIKVFMNDFSIDYGGPIHGNAAAVASTIEEVERMFNVTLPKIVSDTGTGWASWRSLNRAAGKHLVKWFYNTSEISNGIYPYASAAYKLGNGFVILNCWPPINVLHTSNPEVDPEKFVAEAAIYFAVYIYIKAFILHELE